MTCCCSSVGDEVERRFSRKKAAKDLARYLAKGPGPTTRLLLVGLTKAGPVGGCSTSAWRASTVGVYRLWRDLGYALGDPLAGFTADALGFAGAMWIVAGITFASGLVVAVRMSETMPHATA
jgi:hypothetical protein